jgi:hypothetical protein
MKVFSAILASYADLAIRVLVIIPMNFVSPGFVDPRRELP